MKGARKNPTARTAAVANQFANTLLAMWIARNCKKTSNSDEAKAFRDMPFPGAGGVPQEPRLILAVSQLDAEEWNRTAGFNDRTEFRCIYYHFRTNVGAAAGAPACSMIEESSAVRRVGSILRGRSLWHVKISARRAASHHPGETCGPDGLLLGDCNNRVAIGAIGSGRNSP
jgi:hypothetical protein